jgi:4-phosphopantoate--beta-alanine ligase
MAASITIVDNITRAIPILNQKVEELKGKSRGELENIVNKYNNKEILSEALKFISLRLNQLSQQLFQK